MEYKDYRIVTDGTFSMFVIKAKAQGQVPEELRGMYTSSLQAQIAIDGYVPKRGGKKNVPDERGV